MGIGNEDVLGAPMLLGSVYAACDGVAMPRLEVHASVCQKQTKQAAVNPGDTVEISIHVAGTNAIVIAQDVQTGAVAKVSASLADCGTAGAKSMVKSMTIGSFPLVGDDGRTPMQFPATVTDDQCDCFSLHTDAATYGRAVVRQDSTGSIKPQQGDDGGFVLITARTQSACTYTNGVPNSSAFWSTNFPTHPDWSTQGRR